MYEPPPGYLDLIADAERVPLGGEMTDIEIPHVGVVSARRPRPRAAAALAMTVNTKLLAGDRIRHPVGTPLPEREAADKAKLLAVQMAWFSRFVTDHIGAEEYGRIAEAMIEESVTDDAVKRVAHAIACWGTARPYIAVTTLSLFTAHNWRDIRHRLAFGGIADPMKLPSLHVLLDITEEIVVDRLARSGVEREGPPSPGEMAVRKFYDAIYAPDPDDPLDVAESGGPRVPPGFDDPSEVEADFDAFLRGS
jgi:hypothetical protein